jgi:hypothetical protein
MQGTISEFRIYNGALRAGQIAATQALGPDQLLSNASAPLGATVSGSSLTFSWPLASAGFILQGTTNLAAPSWTNVVAIPQILDGQWQITLPTFGQAGYYRLIQ